MKSVNLLSTPSSYRLHSIPAISSWSPIPCERNLPVIKYIDEYHIFMYICTGIYNVRTVHTVL
jgi:hypothetical protein